MSDSEKSNELDSYGVWVKKPPRTIDSSESDEPKLEATEQSSNLTSDEDDTALSTDELAALSSIVDDQPAEENLDSSSTSMEDVSLDEFGFGDSDSDSGNEVAGEESEETAPEIDDAGSSEIIIKDNSSADMDEDGPIDIDLSFDDTGDSSPSGSEFSLSDDSTSPSGDDGTESVDLSEFGFGDDTDSGDSSVESSSENSGTEDVDLSEFGFGDDSDSSEPSVETDTEPTEQSSETEDVDLSEFGFDDDSDSDSASTSESKEGDIEMNVVADDDDEFESTEEAAESSSESEEAASNDNIDSEFNADEIMNSVEDENGNIVSFDDTTETKEDEDSPFEVTSEDKAAAEEFSLDEPLFKEDESAESEDEEIEEPVVSDEDSETIEEPMVPSDDEPTISSEAEGASDSIGEPDFGGESIEGTESDAEDDIEEPVVNEETEDGFSGNEIPDTFDEETASLMGNEDEQQNTASETNSILNQIVSQLSSLKDEISTLKHDVESIKSAPLATKENGNEEQAEEKAEETESSGGFFNDNADDDDTISLSLDELDNILDTAEITEDNGDFIVEAQENNGIESEEQQEESEETTEEQNPESDAPSSETNSLDSVEDSTLESVINNDTSDEDSEEEPEIDQELDSSIADSIEKSMTDDIADEMDDGNDLPIEDNTLESIIDSGEVSKELPDEIDIDKIEDDMDEDDEMDDFSFDTEDSDLKNDLIVDADNNDDLASIGEAIDSAEAEDSIDLPENNGTEGMDVSETSEDELDTDYLTPDPSIDDALSDSNLDYLNSDPALSAPAPETEESLEEKETIPNDLKTEIKSVLSYMDQLLENLPEEKIAEFAQSEQFETYKKLFKELGLA
nr:hypothetical protein [Treponema sp.]